MHQIPDTKPGPYYVSALDGPKTYLMAGPYAAHQDALAMVATAREVAERNDHSGKSVWMAWGTVRIEGCEKIGRLNQLGMIDQYGECA